MSEPLWAAQPPVSMTAPAKLNLFLHIVGRREDGYHLLESLFAFTAKGDVVTVSAAAEFSFTIKGPFAQALVEAGGGGARNLVAKAAHALAGHAGLAPNVAISLEKNLPIAAGIGGGSSDAAATLLALESFWRLGLETSELETIALDLGADVPACLHGKPLFVEGIGEKLTPVRLGWQKGVLLVNPRREVPTPAVFSAYHKAGTGFDNPLVNATDVCGDFSDLSQGTNNALEASAAALCPDIRQVLDALSGLDGAEMVRMSGSGATCFALFETAENAKAAQCKIEAEHKGWWAMADTVC